MQKKLISCQTFVCNSNNHKYNQEYGKLKNWIPSQVYLSDLTIHLKDYTTKLFLPLALGV